MIKNVKGILLIYFQEACKRLLFSDGIRTALVMVSLLTLFPVGIISLVFWILVSTDLLLVSHLFCFRTSCVYMFVMYLLTRKRAYTIFRFKSSATSPLLFVYD